MFGLLHSDFRMVPLKQVTSEEPGGKLSSNI